MKQMSERRYTLACPKCCRGWWGTPGDRCTGCGEEGQVRGTVGVTKLRGDDDG
jgi:hypothetical protein